MSILAPDGSPARPRRTERRAPRARSWWDVYEAANRADFRGYFYLPSLNPAEQLNSLSLRAIRERTDFLYANVGAVRILINRLPLAEAGTGIWPKWTTGDEAFDQAATDAFHFANHDPRVFSADGQNDAYSVQYNIRRSIAKGGDCFGQLLRPNPGATHPQMSLIPGWQCDNLGDEKPGDGWRDGIRVNARPPAAIQIHPGRSRDRAARGAHRRRRRHSALPRSLSAGPAPRRAVPRAGREKTFPPRRHWPRAGEWHARPRAPRLRARKRRAERGGRRQRRRHRRRRRDGCRHARGRHEIHRPQNFRQHGQ